MARKLRTTTPRARDIGSIRCALGSLQAARKWLKEAGATRAAAYVSRAIKSAEGAERHAQRTLPFESRTVWMPEIE